MPQIAAYTYDATGQRIIKYLPGRLDAYYSAKDAGSADRLEAILYPSPLLTVKTMPLPESMEYDELQRTSITTYTKHYYIGTERIASALGTMKNLGLLCEVVWPGDQTIITEMGTKTIAAGNALIADYFSFEKDLQLPEPYLYETYICADLDHHPENYDAYWYHPDHLGSSNYITNLAGMVNQHMEYLPFGETLVEEHLNSYNSPYKFNAKEFDAETGNYYYGARYYNPKWSIWLSVDPLASYDPVMETEFYGDGEHNGGFYNNFNLNSYIYCYQNPVRYLDPNGKQVDAVKNGVASGKNVVNDITKTTLRPKMSSVNGIVLHRTVTSTASSAINSTKATKGRVGFHIVIDINGHTTQVNNLENRANHVGKPKGDSEISNYNSIGIEVVGMGYDKDGNDPYSKNFDGTIARWDDLTPEQIESTAKAIFTIMQEYDLGTNDIYSHEDVSRKQPNEGGFIYDAVKDKLNNLLNPPVPPPVDSSLDGTP